MFWGNIPSLLPTPIKITFKIFRFFIFQFDSPETGLDWWIANYRGRLCRSKPQLWNSTKRASQRLLQLVATLKSFHYYSTYPLNVDTQLVIYTSACTHCLLLDITCTLSIVLYAQQLIGWLLEFYVLATSDLLSGWVPTFDSVHSWGTLLWYRRPRLTLVKSNQWLKNWYLSLCSLVLGIMRIGRGQFGSVSG